MEDFQEERAISKPSKACFKETSPPSVFYRGYKNRANEFDGTGIMLWKHQVLFGNFSKGKRHGTCRIFSIKNGGTLQELTYANGLFDGPQMSKNINSKYNPKMWNSPLYGDEKE